MDRTRSSLGFTDELNDLDAEDWSASEAKSAVPVRKAAAAAGFTSREAQPSTAADLSAKRPLRRRRTGRNAQFNIKARPDTIAAFTRVADDQEWGLGETLEHAVALLEKAYSTKG